MAKYLHTGILMLAPFCLLPSVGFAQNDLSPTEDVCALETRSYRVEGDSNSVIHWTVTGGNIIDDGVPQGTSFSEATVASGLVFESAIQVEWGDASGTFQLTAQEETENSCVSGDLSLDVTIHALPDISGLSFTVPTPTCYNSAPMLTVTGLEANTAYIIGYDDNGISKAETATTDETGSCTLTMDTITADASYNMESVSFDDGTGCQANPSLSVQTTLIDNTAPSLDNLLDLGITECAEDETAIPQVKSFTGMEPAPTRYSDNFPATLAVQYQIQLPDNSFANNYGEQAVGSASSADPSGFEFPEGISSVYFRIMDACGNISNEESYEVTVDHKPNPSNINY